MPYQESHWRIPKRVTWHPWLWILCYNQNWEMRCRYQKCIHNSFLYRKVWWWDGSPKLARDDWVREQSEDTDIGLLVQLLKSDKLKKYVVREMDSFGNSNFFWNTGRIYSWRMVCYTERWLWKITQDQYLSLYYLRTLSAT